MGLRSVTQMKDGIVTDRDGVEGKFYTQTMQLQ